MTAASTPFFFRTLPVRSPPTISPATCHRVLIFKQRNQKKVAGVSDISFHEKRAYSVWSVSRNTVATRHGWNVAGEGVNHSTRGRVRSREKNLKPALSLEMP